MGLPHLPPQSCTRRSALLALAAGPLALATPRAFAQIVRTFPEKARPGRLEMRIFPDAVLDGEAVRLAAGARIHDAQNRIVMPASLSGTHDVLVEDDASGQIGRVWILTPDEREAARERQRNAR